MKLTLQKIKKIHIIILLFIFIFLTGIYSFTIYIDHAIDQRIRPKKKVQSSGTAYLWERIPKSYFN